MQSDSTDLSPDDAVTTTFQDVYGDWQRVLKRVRSLREQLAHAESLERALLEAVQGACAHAHTSAAREYDDGDGRSYTLARCKTCGKRL